MSRTAPLIAVAIVLATASGLSGCASPAPDIAASTSELMQSTVVEAAGQAAAGDASGSLTTLDSLQAQLDSAIGSGEVSASRAQSIQEAIDLVRADLQPVPVTAPEPTSTPAPETVAPVEAPVGTGTIDTGVPDPADESGDDGDSGVGNSGKGDDGKGNNGNGKGNDGNGAGKGPGKN